MHRFTVIWLFVSLGFLCSVAGAAEPLWVHPSPQAVTDDDDGVMRFSFIVVNDGLDVAHDIALAVPFPGDHELVEASTPPRIDGEVRIWAVGTLPPGAAYELELGVTGTLPGAPEVIGVVGATPRGGRGRAPFRHGFPEEAADALVSTLDADAEDTAVLARVARAQTPEAFRQWCREQVRYEPYRGSLRGARGTLRAGAGNAYDQSSLLIAGLRALGVPARYAFGQLPDEDASALISTMFPPSAGVLTPPMDPETLRGLLEDRELLVEQFGQEFVDLWVPEDPDEVMALLFENAEEDPELLDAARDHVWVEYWDDGAWQAYDPSRSLSPPAPTTTALSVDESDRHTVTVTMTAESFNPLFGGALRDSEEAYLAVTVPSVQLSGRAISVRHRVDIRGQGGLVFSTVRRTYTPELWVGDRRIAEGRAVQEIATNFPGGSQLITGVFADLRIESPEADPVDYRHTLVDLLGPAARLGGDEDLEVVLEVDPQTPVLGALDVLSVTVAPGRLRHREYREQAFQGLQLADRHEAMRPVVAGILDRYRDLDEPTPTPTERATLEGFESHVVDTHVHLGALAGLRYFSEMDRQTALLADLTMVHSWVTRPRAVIASVRAVESGPALAMDVAHDSVSTAARPGVDSQAESRFRTTRGLSVGTVEGWALEVGGADRGSTIDFGSVVLAAQEQGVGFRTLSPLNAEDLDRLDLPSDADARIRAALAADRIVILPERPVVIADTEALVWGELDPETGVVRTVDPSGRHGAEAIEYSLTDRVLESISGGVLGGIFGFLDRLIVGLPELLYFGMSLQHGYDAGEVQRQQENALFTLWLKLPVCAFGLVGPPPWAIPAINFGIGVGGNGFSPAALVTALVSTLATALYRVIINVHTLGQGSGPFLAAFGVGVCLGRWYASLLVLAAKAALVDAVDPPLPWFAAGASQAARDPVWRASVRRQGSTIENSPVLGADDIAVHGEVSVTTNDAVGRGGQLSGDGRLVGLFDEHDGPGDGVVYWASSPLLTVQGTGRVAVRGDSVIASLDGASAALDPGDLVLAEGENLPMDVYTVVDGTWGWTGFGPVASRGGTVEMGQGTSFNPGASVGVVAVAIEVGVGLVVDPSLDVLVVEPLDPVTVVAGDSASFAPQVRTREELPEFELIAEGPEGWDVFVTDDGQVRVIPGPGARGEHNVYVTARLGDLEAGTVVPVTVETGRGPVIGLAHDEIFTVGVDGVPAPLVLRADVANQGTQDDIYTLDLELPEGWSARASDELSLAAGARSRLNIALYTEVLPQPGSTVTVRAVLTGAHGEGEDVLTLTVPALPGVALTTEPELSRLVPGSTASVSLIAQGLGNAAGTLELRTGVGSNVTIDGLPETLDVVPNETQTIPLRLTLREGLPLGLLYSAEVSAFRGEVRVGLGHAPVLAFDPSAVDLVEVATLARELGRDDVADHVLSLADSLAAGCGEARLPGLAQQLTNLAAALTGPDFEDLAAGLHDFATALSDATCEGFDGDALVALLRDLTDRLTALRDHDFSIALEPNGVLASPDEVLEFGLRVERTGRESTTIDLVTDGLESQTDSPVLPDVLIEAHPVLATANPEGTQTLRITATARQAPALVRSAQATVAVRAQFVGVVRVSADPGFALQGATIRPFADLVNTAAVPQQIQLQLRAVGPDAEVLFETEDPAAVNLPASGGLHRYDLGKVETYGVSPGQIRLELQITDGEGAPVPGGSAVGFVPIGLPVDVSLAHADRLPSGLASPTVGVVVERRPLPSDPELPEAVSIEEYVGTAQGPNGLANPGGGSLYFTNFGTRRRSDEPGFEPSFTVDRVGLLGQVEEFAVVGRSPTGMAVGPDGHLYVANAGNPERISRVTLPDGQVSTYWDFEQNRPEGGGRGENIIGLAFDAEGNLYATDLYEPRGLGIVDPGKRIYKLTPDANQDGLADAAVNHVSAGLRSPAQMILDPRTQELLVSDLDNDRVVRVTTAEPVELAPLLETGKVSGLLLDDDYRLWALHAESGEVWVHATEVVDGRTVAAEGELLFAGLDRPLAGVFDDAGNLVTTAFEQNKVVRVNLAPPTPWAEIGLAVTHRPTDSVRQDSATPDLGVDGPNWQDGAVGWAYDLPELEPRQEFSVGHDVEGAAGDTIPLSEGTAVTLAYGEAQVELQLPAIAVAVGHAVGLSPESVDTRTGVGATFSVTLHNLRDETETFSLEVRGLPPEIAVELATGVAVDPGETADVTLELTPGGDAAHRTFAFDVVATSDLGSLDAASAALNVVGDGVQVSAAPGIQQVLYQNQAAFQVTLTRAEDDGCRAGHLVTEGLDAISEEGEVRRLVDWFRMPDVIVREIERTITAPAGIYPVTFRLQPLINCGGTLSSTVLVEVLDDHRLEVEVEPQALRAWRGLDTTVVAAVTNHSPQGRWLALTWDGGGRRNWSPVEPDAPFLVAPGATYRATVRLTPDVSADTYEHELQVEDVDDGLAAAGGYTVEVLPRMATMTLLPPAEVTAVEGAATFTLRFEKDRRDPEITLALDVRGPVAFSAAWPDMVRLEEGESELDVEVTLADLNGLGPGPWPVLFEAYIDGYEDLMLRAHGAVTVEGGGLELVWIPDAIGLVEPGVVDVQLVVRNLDFVERADAELTLESDSPGVSADAETTLSVAPGQAEARVVRVTVPPGQHVLTAEAMGAEADLLLAALDPENAPMILDLEVEPDPEEGAEVVFTVVAEDRDDDELLYSFDLGDDGEFEIVRAQETTFTTRFDDDGTVSLAVAVEDPQGQMNMAVFQINVANLPPVFDSQPPTEAVTGEEYVYQPAISDPGADVVTVALEEGPEGASLRDGTLEWNAMAGNHEFRLVARDEDGGEATQAWTVVVEPANPDNRPPAAPEITDPKADDTVASPVTFAWETAVDPDGDVVRYEVEVATDDTFAEIAQTDDTEELQTSLELEEGHYAIRVRGLDPWVAGPWSETVPFEVLAPSEDVGPSDADAGPDAGDTGADASDAGFDDTPGDDLGSDGFATDEDADSPGPTVSGAPSSDCGCTSQRAAPWAWWRRR